MASGKKMIRYVGVDFGTSTSAVCYRNYQPDGTPIRPEDEGILVKFEQIHTTVPTLIFDSPGGKTYFGDEAERRAQSEPAGLKSGFKMDLVSEDPEARERGRELTDRFFAYLYEQYDFQAVVPYGVEVEEKTLVSYPAKWTGEAREATLEAAKRAGFKSVEGVEEPSAAMTYFLNVRTRSVEKAMENLRDNGVLIEGKPVTTLLIDMGAGTTDFVLYRYTPGENECEFLPPVWPPVGHEGFGGREVDELLWERLLDPLVRLAAERNELPYELYVQRYKRTTKTWKELEVVRALRDRDRIDHPLGDLSLVGNMAEPLGLDREKFEEELSDYLAHFPRLLKQLVEHAVEEGSIGSGEDIELVVLTGGHSQWYFINEMLTASESPLGMVRGESYRVVRGPHPQETVARGLAMAGMHTSNRVAPVVPGWRAASSADVSVALAQVVSYGAGWAKSIAFSPDGASLAIGGVRNAIEIVKLSTGEVLHRLVAPLTFWASTYQGDTSIQSLAFSPGGHFLASGHSDSRLRIWRVADGQLLHRSGRHAGTVESVAFSPDGRLVASCSRNGTIKLLNPHKGELVHDLYFGAFVDEDYSMVLSFIDRDSMAFSPGGRLIAVREMDGLLLTWDVYTGELYPLPHEHVFSGNFHGVAFSPNGHLLASSSNYTAIVWNRITGKLMGALSNDSESVLKVGRSLRHKGVMFTPDSRLLIHAYWGDYDEGYMSEITIWDVSTGQKAANVSEIGMLNQVALSPDGQFLAATSTGSDMVKIWQLRKN